ncbi:hypothetical protein C2845_PM15G15620 [Panicum miliaceum]|uniref:Uncharacterized protein n=1 Tax=Panicum miliaceum TaxID=4540 RepID=A0A3L6Q8I9_PANMI|nr:hypothetical protein C2845_PM15G15620 [Panicum miliaceum]
MLTAIDHLIAAELAKMRRNLRWRMQKLDELWRAKPAVSTTPSLASTASIGSSPPPTPCTTAAPTALTSSTPTAAPTTPTISTTTSPSSELKASAPSSTTSLATSVSPAAPGASTAAPTIPLPATTAAPPPTPAPATPSIDEEIFTTSTPKCSTKCLTRGIDLLKPVNTITSILTAPPTLFHFSADSPLDANKGFSLEFMPSRYITKFNSAYSVGDVLLCLATDGHEAQFEELTPYGSVILEPLCDDMAGIGPWPPPKQHYHILLHETIQCSLWPPFSNDWVTSQQRPPWPPPQLDRNNLLTDSVQLRPIPWPNFTISDTMVVSCSIGQSVAKLLFADISGESWQYWLEPHETAVQLGGMKWKDTRQSQFSVGINVHLQKIGEYFSIFPDITNLVVFQSCSVKCCWIQWEISWPLCTMVCWFGEGLLVITTLQLLWQCCTRGVEFLFLRQIHEHMQGSKFLVWTAFQLPLSLFESVKPWPCAISLFS